ncbi:hypothetical protein Rsub_07623 [Raphidocelis subcapitata]|uniref:Uncharacterized protein n=1 Tax=Raphidocelis subcapitata TaxID=307507 RepID=A0A2V0PA52_9CHLO|nr:hypothetical protein Rsub_07623 [Raphidocelis subcapitata]|eukprot:GBF94740.1 hypothetical protein Rsub_07623 [Raphidocelis subcapitata]
MQGAKAAFVNYVEHEGLAKLTIQILALTCVGCLAYTWGYAEGIHNAHVVLPTTHGVRGAHGAHLAHFGGSSSSSSGGGGGGGNSTSPASSSAYGGGGGSGAPAGGSAKAGSEQPHSEHQRQHGQPGLPDPSEESPEGGGDPEDIDAVGRRRLRGAAAAAAAAVPRMRRPGLGP